MNQKGRLCWIRDRRAVAALVHDRIVRWAGRERGSQRKAERDWGVHQSQLSKIVNCKKESLSEDLVKRLVRRWPSAPRRQLWALLRAPEDQELSLRYHLWLGSATGLPSPGRVHGLRVLGDRRAKQRAEVNELWEALRRVAQNAVAGFENDLAGRGWEPTSARAQLAREHIVRPLLDLRDAGLLAEEALSRRPRSAKARRQFTRSLKRWLGKGVARELDLLDWLEADQAGAPSAAAPRRSGIRAGARGGPPAPLRRGRATKTI